MEVFHNSKWIWQNNEDRADEYVHFIDYFSITAAENVFLNISVDSNYTVWVNGKLVTFGQYADFPYYKVYDHIDISEYVTSGKNKIAILCWYYGCGSLVYFKNKPGLIYEIVQEEKVLAASNKEVLCRVAPDYINYFCENITPQVGFNFHYDMSRYDEWNSAEYIADKTFGTATEVTNMPSEFHVRPIKKLVLEERTNANIISQGTFKLVEAPRKSISLHRAGLFFEEFSEMSGQCENNIKKGVINLKSEKNQGIYFIIDLGREECGFLDLEICLNEKTDIDIAFGEHLVDGRVRSAIGPRNFNCSFIAKKGWQHYLNTFRRLGARYLQFFVHSSEIMLKYAGIRPTNYPVNINSFDFKSKLRNTIYSTSLRTLVLCMHEHYEDCPWREQALYTMDSRNQMLCGYYAFSEFEFARASLKLIGLGQREDGLLPLCTPAGWGNPIPFFSIMYIIQMNEYIQYSGDDSLAKEHYLILKKVLTVFINKVKENGLVDSFQDDKYWNFYEWKDGLEGFYTNEKGEYIQDNRASYDVILNAFVSLGLEHMANISNQLGYKEDFNNYSNLKNRLNSAIFENFYDYEKELFKTFKGKNEGLYSVLANSLCLLCGACPEEYTHNICKAVVEKNPILVESTLSMDIFCFDALLKVNKNLYASFILQEIDEKYGYMLNHGATTFWETIIGDRDFGNAGSLCHGWSAIPVFYYSILIDKDIDTIRCI